MMLGAIAMVVMASVFVSALRHNQTVTAKSTSTADARIALEALTRDLRVAVPPNASTPAISKRGKPVDHLLREPRSEHSHAAPLPSKVDYTIDTTARCLRRTITPGQKTAGVLSWPAAGAVTTCVARGDINSDGSTVFSYYPQVTTLTPSPAPFAFTTGQVGAANLPLIAGVGLTLVDSDPGTRLSRGPGSRTRCHWSTSSSSSTRQVTDDATFRRISAAPTATAASPSSA